MLNYHELTINESRDSPARRQQFLVICFIMMSVLVYTMFTSGLFETVVVTEGIYPGGDFTFKYMERDPAATAGLFRTVSADLSLSEKDWSDLIYSVQLDYHHPSHPDSVIPQGMTRLMVGTLTPHNDENDHRGTLMARNMLVPSNADDLNAGGVFGGNIPYEVGVLPSVDSAVVKFKFTNGFVSALIHSLKVWPALVEYAKRNSEEGNIIVISMTCNVEEKYCLHYAPLLNGDQFYLDKPDMQSYAQSFVEKGKDGLDFTLILKGLKKLFGWK